MHFNAGKCELLRVTRKRKPINADYYLNDTKLKQKSEIKYLGVTIDNKLSWKSHILNKKKKGTKVLNMIRRNLHFAPKEVKETAYMSTVRPIIEYASTVWSPNSEQLKEHIETVQNNAAKFVLNKYPNIGYGH